MAVHNVRARWEDADHLAAPTIHVHHLSDDRPSSEGGLPQLVREDDQRWQQGRGLSWRRWRAIDVRFSCTKNAPPNGLYPKGLQQMLVDVGGTHTERSIACRQIDF